MYHWFFLLEITVVNIMNNLNVCSTHSYLYQWFSPVSSTNKTYHNDTTEIMLKVALNTINPVYFKQYSDLDNICIITRVS
jgi:hypothetical protein